MQNVFFPGLQKKRTEFKSLFILQDQLGTTSLSSNLILVSESVCFFYGILRAFALISVILHTTEIRGVKWSLSFQFVKYYLSFSTFWSSSIRAESGFLGCTLEISDVFFPGKINPLSVLHSSLDSMSSCLFTVSGWTGRTVAELYWGQYVKRRSLSYEIKQTNEEKSLRIRQL